MESSVFNRFSQDELVPLDLAGRIGTARSRSTIRYGEKKNVHSRRQRAGIRVGDQGSLQKPIEPFNGDHC